MSEVRRIVCHFSCGASSAVATKIAIEENKRKTQLPLVVVRCIVREEHVDNERFAADCEKWFGVSIQNLINAKYDGSIYKVFEKERYIAGIAGARCSRALKREVGQEFAALGDLDVIGFTADPREQDRFDRLMDANRERRLWPILIERNLLKSDCLAIVERAGIKLPEMYALGYEHNNCLVCVKGGAGYLNKARRDFPEEFARMSKVSRDLGVRLVKIKGVRMFLDELPNGAGNAPDEPEVQCGIFCLAAEKELGQ